MSNPILLAGFKAALDAETNPSDPLSTVSPDSIDEFLGRINDDFADGKFAEITTERLDQLINAYRIQAMNWEMEEQTEKTRKPRNGTKKSVPSVDTSDFQF